MKPNEAHISLTISIENGDGTYGGGTTQTTSIIVSQSEIERLLESEDSSTFWTVFGLLLYDAYVGDEAVVDTITGTPGYKLGVQNGDVSTED